MYALVIATRGEAGTTFKDVALSLEAASSQVGGKKRPPTESAPLNRVSTLVREEAV